MNKLSFHLSLASLASVILLTCGLAMAQTAPAETAAKPAAAAKDKSEKVKNLNFEDELVQGATQKPELFYLFQKKNFNYKRLIKLRENFLPEMRRTAEEVQRVRSQD